MLDQTTKVCRRCEAIYPRNPKESEKQWTEREFCGRGCASRFRAEQRPIAPRQMRLSLRPDYGMRLPKPGRNGYYRQWAPEHPLAGRDGLVVVHRRVWYDAHGDIPAGYDVHHRNENKADNSLGNLVLLSHSDHQQEHSRPGTLRKNQYGAAPILDLDGRRERARRRAYWRKVLGNEGTPPPDWQCPPRTKDFKARK